MEGFKLFAKPLMLSFPILNELYHKMLCLIQIYWGLGFSPKGVFSKSGLNSGQDPVAKSVNLGAVAGADDGGGIDLLNGC